ncbi:hypothetical protein FRC10_007380 [Ceratobasidium sp. 414]|nr:hypothetical protein FRC10_007380 [Ceratobasidium sp. 414]
MPPKRKRSESVAGPSKAPAQRATNTYSSKPKAGASKPEAKWPVFFQDALNTVIAFCSSRKHLALTFSVVRKSVEGLIKQALLPDLVRFAYLNAYELRVNAASAINDKDKFDPYAPSNFSAPTDESEHVLVLDFAGPGGGPRLPTGTSSSGFTLPVALTPAAMKTLIEKRNERFSTAVDELIAACLVTSEDPVVLLTNAAQDHIPVDPATILDQTHASSSRTALSIPTPKDRKPIEEVITDLKHSEDEEHLYRDQIVYERVFDQREARWGKLDRPLPGAVAHALESARSVTGFYSHQAEAINAIWSGKNTIVSTSTASGKSIIYQVPILCALQKDKDVTAMFIYPTKALAQDQKAAIEQILQQCRGLEHIKVATYDGDTPQDQRAVVRKTASIIFTNFDMLHASILPNEEYWRRQVYFLHLTAPETYKHTDQDVRFVTCSATITDPLRHMTDIFGIEDVEVITDDGAPAGQKHFVLWNPPYIDGQAPSLGKVSSLSEACWLFQSLMKQGVRTIMFCKIRRTCEAVMKAVRTELTSEGRTDILAKVKAYRGGYSQKDRRSIEHEAFSGNLLGIITTNALELGVDIGALDAVIVLGFPFGLASLRQQMGRAGRRARDALTVLVADERPIDQHYVEYPEELFSKDVGELHIDLDNQAILESHLQCAAHEMPIHPTHDQTYFGPPLKAICESSLKQDKDGWFHTNPKFLPYPSKYISIRGIQENKYAVVDVTLADRSEGEAKILEELELSRAIYEVSTTIHIEHNALAHGNYLFQLYEGGVYMHQGQTFIIKEVNHDQKLARMIRTDVNWTTRPRDFKDIDAIQTFRIRAIKKSTKQAFYGSVQVSVKVFGFLKVRGNVILDMVDIETLPYERMTTGLWMDVPKDVLSLIKQKGIIPSEAIHAAQHAILNQTHLANDMKTECKAPQKEYAKYESSRKRPARLIFYDAAGEGSGISAKAFDHVSTLLWKASERLEECPCDDGCPSCIRGMKCAEGNIVCSKIGASLILKSLLDIEIDPDTVPNFGASDIPDTIVEAESVRMASGVKVEFEE